MHATAHLDDPAVADPTEGPAGRLTDGFVELDGRPFFRIADYDRLAPFFVTVVGPGDCWLFASSTGGITAGRVSPDSALFPYYTDDKVADGAGSTGGLTLIRVHRAGARPVLWEPLRIDRPRPAGTIRNLYKDTLGSELVFEELNTEHGLRLRVAWSTSAHFGIVRRVELAATGDPVEVELLDGFVNVLPAGVDMMTQNRLSNLLDAYKRTELDPESGLGLYWLSSRLTDLAEPSESLQANVVWQAGLPSGDRLLSTRALPKFGAGGDIAGEHDVRGQRGAFLVSHSARISADQPLRWAIVGDVQADHADVVTLAGELQAHSDPAQRYDWLVTDLAASREELTGIVAAADGLQCGGDEVASAHHLANVMFNVMRGGLPAEGYRVSAADFREFLAERSPLTARRCAAALGELPDHTDVLELRELAQATGDPDLIRLALEYLPLTFSRRHGDPSRPWNSFQVVLRDAAGNRRLRYEGNWRDIFQNWEALAWSYPEYLESMIAVFANATTADGYNPYRISRGGIDWEIPDPDDPWANIGYWSDHQIIYLLRLLETAERFHPGQLHDLLGQRIFTHADVPYRIAGYAQTLADPNNTIEFDQARNQLIADRVDRIGADGRLVHDGDELLRVTLAEKLLLLLAAKLVNLVPDGGIWMNTQRPEWNDANNALVGRGLSVVTLAQLRRYVAFITPLLEDQSDLRVSAGLATLVGEVTGVLAGHVEELVYGFNDWSRRTVMDQLGAAGTRFRAGVYDASGSQTVALPGIEIRRLLGWAQRYIEASLRANRREDGLFHSYNTLQLGAGTAGIGRLPEMLEGQVAVLSSGMLDADQSLALVQGLRVSALYRADQHSYQLYPDRDLPGFLARNTFRAERAAQCPLVAELLARGDRSLVVGDASGDLHFAAAIRNVRDVEAALDRLAQDPTLTETVAASRAVLLAIFEEVFNHSQFTGRSGSFFAYEGLGSIYWHMVSKLLLAVQENLEEAAAPTGELDPATVAGLAAAYEDIRLGLGYCKDPATYGAFPTDPYSHTPAGHGARQPGMTGQVKEEVITRLGELGLRVEYGEIRFRPLQLRESDWTGQARTCHLIDVHGEPIVVDLPAGSLAFTFCQVPVRYRAVPGAALRVRVELADGSFVKCPDARITGDLANSVFRRAGDVRMIEVEVPAGTGDARGARS